MLRGQKHLVRCRCVLPQYKSIPTPPQHQFAVFSVVKEENVVTKFAQCNNCGIIHKVTDICTSEIMTGKESMNSMVKIDDIKASLSKNLVDILERHEVDLATWENAQFILENKLWGEFVVIAQEEEDGTRQGKYVRIMGENLFKIESFIRSEILAP